MDCRDSGSMQITGCDVNAQSCMGFIQFFSDKNATTLSSTELVVYLANSILFNVSRRRRHSLIDSGHSLVRSLPD